MSLAEYVVNSLVAQDFPVVEWIEASFKDWYEFEECVKYLASKGYTKEMLVSDLQHIPQYIYLPKLSEDDFKPKLKATKNHNEVQIPIYLSLCK